MNKEQQRWYNRGAQTERAAIRKMIIDMRADGFYGPAAAAEFERRLRKRVITVSRRVGGGGRK